MDNAPRDFDPTDPDLADETCRMCDEPASYALGLDATTPTEFATMVMLCKVCEHYVDTQNIDSLIARSADPSESTDLLAQTLIGHRDKAIPFDLGPGLDSADNWD